MCEFFEPENVWISKEQSTSAWFQVDFGQIVSINGLVTQGNPSANEYVSQFTLQLSDDGEIFKTYQEHNPFHPAESIDRVFIGNSDGSTPQYNYFQHSVTSRFVRFRPRNWVGRIAMRVDVLGCNEHRKRPKLEDSISNSTL